jgi:hypothetical protein
LVAEHVRKPDVLGDELPTVSFEQGIVVRRGCPNRPLRMGSLLKGAPALVAIALRHLAAEFDDLPTLRHLNEDTTAYSERS